MPAVGELPERQRDAFVLREFYGLTQDEIAAALDISARAAEALLVRGRRSLREMLGPARAGAGAISVPLSLRDALAQAVPGFASAGATGSATAGIGAVVVAANASSAPLAAKVASVALALTATVAVGGSGTEDATRAVVRVTPLPLTAPASHVAARPGPLMDGAPTPVQASASEGDPESAAPDVAADPEPSPPADAQPATGEPADVPEPGDPEAGIPDAAVPPAADPESDRPLDPESEPLPEPVPAEAEERPPARGAEVPASGETAPVEAEAPRDTPLALDADPAPR